MAYDKIQFYGKIIKFIIPYLITRLYQRFQAFNHRRTYKESPSAKNVVVLGASFAGVQLAKRLSETLPTGYRVVMIEKNSHFNYAFNFPRYSVMSEHERQAFIPYDGIARDAPQGIFRHVRDTATLITEDQVRLASGDRVDYAYLIIATGSWQPLPAKVTATDSGKACAELRTVQENIKSASKVAVVGGGAVGIELATDIKSFYPEKHVTLVHSRRQLLNNFGLRLHEYVLNVFRGMAIETILGERPQILPGAAEDRSGDAGEQKSLRFADGHVEEFDLIISCTGQRPNSACVADLAPDSISKETNRILVKPTLQIADPDDAFPHIFALGDVAETGGPRMARAGQFQAEIVLANIIALINERNPSTVYKPRLDFEGAIKLTLGKTGWVVYSQNDDGSDMLVSGNDGKEDLDVGMAWKTLNVEFKDFSNVAGEWLEVRS